MMTAAVIRILAALAVGACIAGCSTASAFPTTGVTTFGPPIPVTPIPHCHVAARIVAGDH